MIFVVVQSNFVSWSNMHNMYGKFLQASSVIIILITFYLFQFALDLNCTTKSGFHKLI